MTARFLHSFPARNAFRVVKQNQKMTIVTFILYLLGIPMIMGSLMLQLIFDSRQSDAYYGYSFELYAFIGMFCLGAAVFMGMIAAINSFTELHSKSKVDMLYSLPLTGNQRFFSDFIGGCCIYILPYVITVVLGWIITLVMGCFVDWSNLGVDATLGMICRYYALLTFGLLALMLLYFALSSLVTICCGTLFESIYTNVLLNLLIPGTLAAVMGVIASNVELDFEYMWQVIGYISPIGGLIYLVYLVSDAYGHTTYSSWSSWRTYSASQVTEHEMLPAYLRWICIVLVIAALLVVVAWQLYVRRKAEHVGKPFIYLAAYYVMLTAGTVLILCLMSVDVIGPALLFSAIVYFVMEVIRKRGFKKFWLTIVTYVVTVGVSIGLFVLVDLTDCFGRVQYVPASATVNSVRLTFDASVNSSETIVLEYADRDVISAVTKLHKSIVKTRKNEDPSINVNEALTEQKLLRLEFNSSSSQEGFGEYSVNAPSYNHNHSRDISVLGYEEFYWDDEYDASISGYFSAISDGGVGRYVRTVDLELDYYTITGSIIHRSYELVPDEFIQLMEVVQGTELYAQGYGEGLKKTMEEEFRTYNTTTKRYEMPFRTSIKVAVPGSGNYSDVPMQALPVSNLSTAIDKLSDAYRKDLSVMTTEQFRTSPQKCMLYGVPVYAACTETLAVLKEYGFEGFTLPERYRTSGDTGYVDYEYALNVAAYAVRLYAPGTYASASLDYPCSNLGGFFVKNDANGTPAYQDQCYAVYEIEYYPELAALMEVAQVNYVADEACYALVVNGKTYIVPAEHSDLAEAVIEKGNWYVKYGVGDMLPQAEDNFYDDYDDTDWGYGGGGGVFVPDDDYDNWDNWQDWEYGTGDPGTGAGAFVPAGGGQLS